MKTILIEFWANNRVYSLYTHTCASMHAWESQERGNACPVPLPTRGKIVTLNPGLERSHPTVLASGLTLSLPTEPALLHWFPFCTMSPVGRSSQCPQTSVKVLQLILSTLRNRVSGPATQQMAELRPRAKTKERRGHVASSVSHLFFPPSRVLSVCRFSSQDPDSHQTA